MNLVEIKKTPSTRDILLAMKVGDEITVSFENADAFRQMISRKLKYSHPELEFDTETVTGGNLKIRRIK